MTTCSRFRKFGENIKLTTAQYDDAKTKYDNVCRTLHNHYYPKSEYNGSTKLLIGSYGKETAIRPPGDVDVIFKIPFEVYKRFSDNKTGARGLLNEVKGILSKTFTTTETIKPNGMIVEVKFSTFSIEVLPGFEWSIDGWKGQFSVPDTKVINPFNPFSHGLAYSMFQATDYGTWKRIDPRKEISELSSSNNNTSGNAKKLIQMIKKWVQHCNVPIKSVAIERLVEDFLRFYEHAKKSEVYYDYMVRDFFDFLKGKKNSIISMPGINENLNIGEEWYSKTETAYGRAIKACQYEYDKNDLFAATEWRKIFGDCYPLLTI